jgi:ubiquinone/menaquinone biosynthesis C-methylase UbiE
MKTNQSKTPYTCPWWLLFTFDNPMRTLIHNPEKMLDGLIHPGNTVLDVGCGMGYFSLPMAKLVGPHGHVISADLQEQMLAGLRQRAKRAACSERIHPLLCSPDRIGLSEPIDFVLAFWMVHEVRQQESFLQEIYAALKTGGKFLLVEPRIHVSGTDFKRTEKLAQQTGFHVLTRPLVNISRAVVLGK